MVSWAADGLARPTAPNWLICPRPPGRSVPR